jgi:hypothetical protein
MVPQKHTEFSVRSETFTIPELEQSKAAVLNTLASVHSRRRLRICHRQIYRVVLQRTQVDVQSRSCCPVQVSLRTSPSVRLYDQSASFSDSETGG